MDAGNGQTPGGTREPTLVSVVAPVFNEERLIGRFHRRVSDALAAVPHEIVLVDDGSRDGTSAELQRIEAQDPRVRVLALTRNFGHQAALTAGLDHAAGDVVVSIDSDLQDPPELIPEMLRRWSEGADVVCAVRRSRKGETRFKLATARWFYKLFGRLTGLGLTSETGDFRLLDRRALDDLLSMRESNRFLRGMTVWVGRDPVCVPFDRDPRTEGQTGYTLTRMLRLSLDAIVSFSHVPLQLATVMGFLFSLAAFLGLPLVILARVLGVYVPGVSTVLFVVLLLGGIQLITVGIIGEYVGRIYDEVKQRPLYLLKAPPRPAPDPAVRVASPEREQVPAL